MIKLKVVADGFVMGTRTCEVGEIINVMPCSVAYATKDGKCQIVKAEPKPKPKPKAKPKAEKKASYKTRDMQADILD